MMHLGRSLAVLFRLFLLHSFLKLPFIFVWGQLPKIIEKLRARL
jgi:hypothetical protein